jgi:ribonuclease HI
MPGVPRELIEHSLNVDPKATPKRQHLRRFTDDRRDAIKKELAKLLAAGFIREVFHPEWLANLVLGRKKNSNEWRMCVDYTDLNKHCPKDPFGLPRIDQIMDSTAGCDSLCFLDCYSGYHQIAIKEEDQEKAAFITPFGAYFYTTMSFGLKNAGATYQRAIQACFKRQLNKNVEAYVDDVVVKTRNSSTLIADLEETFTSQCEYRWKLNPNKCVFGVPSGKLLGFIISHRGIEANPEKISTVTSMKAPTCIKDMQKLTGCMAALNRFISKLGEQGLPFFKLLKHQEKFVWTTEVDQALAQLKDFLTKPPVLTAPHKGEQLLLYLAATTHVVSTAIIVERQEDGHTYPVQRPVYFVSEVLSESKPRYQPVQKILYAVLITSRKLRHYFQEYSISVVTNYPLGDILRNQDATGRISKWAVELGALNIDFKPRTAIKSQALVDFMAEWRENQLPTPTERPEHWVMYFDGSLNLEGASAGVLLISPTGEQLEYVLQIFWKVSNNEAEYEALLHGLRLAASLGIKRLLVYGDFAVVINQVNKSWDRNKENMDAHCLEVRKLENKFYGLEFHHVVRDNNVAADVLSKLGSTRAQVPVGVFVHELHAPSIPEPAPPTTDPAHPPAGQEVMMIDVDWRQPFIDYLSEQKVPSGKNLAEQLVRHAKSYVFVRDKLYRWGASSGVLMKCVPREEVKDILEEIHKGVCGDHTSSHTLVSKAFRRAFYWPTALGDAEELVRRCQGCQYFAKQQHVPAYKLVTIPPTWPFACWGLDMIGPLPTAPGGFNKVLVAIDKFTKWIEVKPVTCPKADRVLDFLDELVHRYGLPHRIITDLASNFNNHQFWEYCENSGIDV